MAIVSYTLIPLIGAIIGWITNVLAIKMLFRPYNPVKLPFVNYSLQGLIPKRKSEIAHSIGQVIEQELISIDDIVEILKTNQFIDKAVDLIAPILKQTIVKKIPHLIPNALRDLLASLVADALARELPDLVEQYSGQITEEIKKQFSFSQIIENKINEMDWDSLERIVLDVAKKELRHIEVLGGVLGFLIGIVQLIVSILSQTI